MGKSRVGSRARQNGLSRDVSGDSRIFSLYTRSCDCPKCRAPQLHRWLACARVVLAWLCGARRPTTFFEFRRAFLSVGVDWCVKASDDRELERFASVSGLSPSAHSPSSKSETGNESRETEKDQRTSRDTVRVVGGAYCCALAWRRWGCVGLLAPWPAAALAQGNAAPTSHSKARVKKRKKDQSLRRFLSLLEKNTTTV